MILRAPQRAHGYTIVETMIVLVTITALIAGAMALFNGRIAQSRYSTELNEFDSKLRSVMNDAANGVSVTGSVGGCGTGTDTEAGTREDCLFLGKAVHLGVGKTGCGTSTPTKEGCDQIDIYNVYGDRKVSSGALAKNLTEANPQIQGLESYTMGYGLHINSARVGGQDVRGIVFTQTFGNSPPSASDISGVPSLRMDALRGQIGASSTDFGPGHFSAGGPNASWIDASEGINICLQSGRNDQFAIITLASNNRVITTDVRGVDSC